MKLVNVITPVALFLLSACGGTSAIQTTSGSDYLKKYEHVPVVDVPLDRAGSKSPRHRQQSIDEAVRQVAAVEPILEFPARIGLARIGNWGRISNIPQAEAEHWAQLAENLGPSFGEFVPINPLIAKLTAESTPRDHARGADVVGEVRIAAARQHLDAVLLYEVRTSNEIQQNAMAAVDFTLISTFILPSRKVKSEAVGTALLIDVIQGYPYGTVESRVSEDKRATAWGVHSRREALAERLRASVTGDLVVEAESMFNELRLQLLERRLQAVDSKNEPQS